MGAISNQLLRSFQNFIPKSLRLSKSKTKLLNLGISAIQILRQHPKSFKEVGDILKLQVAYVTDIAKGNYKDYDKANWVIIVAALLYVVSPIDFIPDFIPGLGWTDDISVILYVFKKMGDELDLYQLWKNKQVEDDIPRDKASDSDSKAS